MKNPLPPVKERPYLATMEQLADIRLFSCEEGLARGMRIVRADNGSGLSFTLSPDRGMDIVDCRFRGVPIAFRTPVGYAAPAHFVSHGLAWLRNWQGGLLTTSGLRNSGNPNGDFGLHGRADNLPCEDLALERGLDGDGRYCLRASGVLREASMFGENIRWQRSIETAYQTNAITLHDRFTNLNPTGDYLQLLYHCNFGYPFVSPDLQFIMPEHEVTARTEKARCNIAEWNRLDPPIADYEEECFYHKLPADENGKVSFELHNPVLGIGVRYCYDSAELPQLVEWKNTLEGAYVLGIEPCNVSLAGRTEDIASGKARRIAPYETIETHLTIEFLDIVKK